MKNRRLFVIGNGFDRFHGIQSSYGDFRDYLEEENEGKFLQGISQFIDWDDLWSNFEYALGCLNEEELREKHSDMFIDYGDDNWRDSANHDYQMCVAEDLRFSKDIPKHFSEWIRSLDTDVEKILSSNYINNDSLYLNFNYTDVLERIYSIRENNILYIHGKTLRRDKLIAGHHNKNFSIYNEPIFKTQADRDNYYEEKIERDFRLKEVDEIIKSYFKSTYKDVEGIIKYYQNSFKCYTGIEEVFVLGHSVSQIDIAYFNEINKHVAPSCVWYVSYYCDEDIQRANYNLNSIGISNIQFIKINQLA